MVNFARALAPQTDHHVCEVRAAFGVGPFFTPVVPRAVAQRLARRPWDPLPHMRARRALARSGREAADG